MNHKRAGQAKSLDDIETQQVSTDLSDNPRTKPRERIKNISLLLLLVFTWYFAATLSIITSKTILIAFPFPFTLCTCQFIMGAIISSIVSWFSKKQAHDLHKKSIFSSTETTPLRWIIAISVSYTLGFIFTNIAFSLVHVSFAETIKAGEPISSVLIGLLILNESNSMQTYLSLLPICIGVSISCIGDFGFKLSGFIFSLLSNFCFSYRAVMSKHLLKVHAMKYDEIELFYYISTLGLVLLVPLCCYVEGTKVIGLLSMNGNIAKYLVPLYLANGLAYSTYNIMSILVLSRTDLVTHAVLNAFRRVFIIVSTSFYFHVHLSSLNISGVFVAILGVILFALAKAGVAFW